nr:protein UmuC-like protein [Raoultella sp. NCTC 9187]
MRTSPHAENEAFYAPQASGRLATPSDDTRDIIRVAIHALDRVWKDGFRYMKAGIMLGDFFSQAWRSSTCLMSISRRRTAPR